MSRLIQKIKLSNFKRFVAFEAGFDGSLNLLVGDNESGKSTILLALDLVLGGSRGKIDSIGLENLLNIGAVNQFLVSKKDIRDLPILFVEVYLTEQNEHRLNGRNNSDVRDCDGLRLECIPSDSLSKEIKSILEREEPNFPFEYYEARFFTFSGDPYSAYNRSIKHILIDSAQISNEYATREYVKDLYHANIEGAEKNKYQYEYRRHKEQFKTDILCDINCRLDQISFVIRTTGKSNLESDLTIAQDGISIENKGRGQQCFIKTDFALKKTANAAALDIVLLEEPENHLSHINMKKLIRKIQESVDKQLFIATHNDLVSARLGLQKCTLLNSNSIESVSLKELPNETAEFFMKAPDNSILQFILSKKVVLVEGDAEFILFEAFFRSTHDQTLEDADVHVISVDGTSFKRYLDIARLLKIRTAVLRDNDGNCEQNCVERYKEYVCDYIRVFYDKDAKRSTFEVCVYEDNKDICEELFAKSRKTLSVEEYMLKNKAEAAFAILKNKADRAKAPQYISDAVKWIRE